MYRGNRMLITAFALLALPLAAGAQSFEGVIKERSFEMDEQALYELIWADADEEPDFDTQAEWFRYTAKKLFEIPIDQLIDGGVEYDDVTMYIKGTKVRYAPSGGGAGPSYMMMDLATMTTWIVMPGEKAYVEVTSEAAEAAAENATRQAEEMMKSMGIDPEELAAQAAEMDEYEGEMEGEAFFEPSVRGLNRTEEVNGMMASAYAAEAGPELGQAWCSEDVTGMIKAMEKLTAQMEEDEEGTGGPSVDELLCKSELPVRKQVLSFGDMGGGLWYRVEEILAVERTSVPDDQFEIPAGFEKRTMEDMWR